MQSFEEKTYRAGCGHDRRLHLSLNRVTKFNDQYAGSECLNVAQNLGSLYEKIDLLASNWLDALRNIFV